MHETANAIVADAQAAAARAEQLREEAAAHRDCARATVQAATAARHMELKPFITSSRI
jgi:hypothetical protein